MCYYDLMTLNGNVENHTIQFVSVQFDKYFMFSGYPFTVWVYWPLRFRIKRTQEGVIAKTTAKTLNTPFSAHMGGTKFVSSGS